ncbi:MAG: bifunctional 5,10-methylenetetrahydrofolate dehydrogenase/5,10-methenyltetrahydrofolate cyclohydrolase [Candidatus Aminicenantes bacterium]|nr:bifunctional 5,10-methylenetetrahydrofolate dehydrogenase/5,10-methenyltetrahydrofolate cyclohydrolase [Candidatus Aminicenantes bacterium]
MKKLDGKEVSAKIQEQVKAEIESLKEKTGRVPGLTVVIVGDDPASKIYVRSKDKMAAKLGINSRVIRLDAEVSRQELIGKIKELNEDDEVDGVLVQLPLPGKFDTWDILDHLDPGKDADSFLPAGLGMILLNRSRVFPCTPAGILKILEYYEIDVTGMDVVVVGRSFIVGKPIAAMLTNLHATVTVCHTRTKDLPAVVRRADMVVAAVGKAGIIGPDMVKEGAVLIDVGVNRLNKKEEVERYCTERQQEKFVKKGYGICGDIHKDAYAKSSYYTPVPGGVGLMTVAMLMHNTLQLFKKRVKT